MMTSANFNKHYHFGDTWSVQNGIRGLEKFNNYKAECDLERQRENDERLKRENEERVKQRQARLERLVLCMADKTYMNRKELLLAARKEQYDNNKQ